MMVRADEQYIFFSGCGGSCEDQCVGPFQEDSACCIAHRYDPIRNDVYCVSMFQTSPQGITGNKINDEIPSCI